MPLDLLAHAVSHLRALNLAKSTKDEKCFSRHNLTVNAKLFISNKCLAREMCKDSECKEIVKTQLDSFLVGKTCRLHLTKWDDAIENIRFKQELFKIISPLNFRFPPIRT